ncbi:hypothetical protein, partial [Thermoplasma sp.]|uniref:hypothetical protein n=1 Tax=Thermoplasma sp. TaxID=1973142 RepID=UPI002618B692
LVVGFSGGTGVEAQPLFYIQPGSNYMAANMSVGFGWHARSSSESEVIGNITLGVMTNETIYEVNVLDINFTSSMPGTFNVTINVPSAKTDAASGGSAFPAGTTIYLSESPFYISGTTISNSGSVDSFSLASPGSHTFTFYNVTDKTTIYVAFEIGSGSILSGKSAPSFSLSMSESIN